MPIKTEENIPFSGFLFIRYSLFLGKVFLKSSSNSFLMMIKGSAKIEYMDSVIMSRKYLSLKDINILGICILEPNPAARIRGFIKILFCKIYLHPKSTV